MQRYGNSLILSDRKSNRPAVEQAENPQKQVYTLGLYEGTAPKSLTNYGIQYEPADSLPQAILSSFKRIVPIRCFLILAARAIRRNQLNKLYASPWI